MLRHLQQLPAGPPPATRPPGPKGTSASARRPGPPGSIEPGQSAAWPARRGPARPGEARPGTELTNATQRGGTWRPGAQAETLEERRDLSLALAVGEIRPRLGLAGRVLERLLEWEVEELPGGDWHTMDFRVTVAEPEPGTKGEVEAYHTKVFDSFAADKPRIMTLQIVKRMSAAEAAEEDQRSREEGEVEEGRPARSAGGTGTGPGPGGAPPGGAPAPPRAAKMGNATLGDAGGAPRGGAAVSFAANNATAAGAAPPKPKRKGFTLDADWDMVPKKKAPAGGGGEADSGPAAEGPGKTAPRQGGFKSRLSKTR